MEYTLRGIKIDSDWFDNHKKIRKKTIYEKIGYKGLNLYFQLYKFRLHNQKNEHTFVTSLSLLRKETKYTTNQVFELLKKLKAAKVIEVENVSRWDSLIDKETFKVKDDKTLMITAVNPFPITSGELDGRYYIYVPLDLFEIYKDKGLNEKYYALYCLIQKWSHNIESKMYMSIENMAKILGFDKDYVNRMIYTMSRNYFMYSNKRKKKIGKGYLYEHYILTSGKEEDIEKFLKQYKDKIDKFVNRLDKRIGKNKVNNEEEGIDELDFDELEYEPIDEPIHTSIESVPELHSYSVDEMQVILSNDLDEYF